MSEKRFVIDEKTNYKDYPIILDTKTGDWWVIQDTMMGTGKLLDLLNELSEENEQLKIANAKWFDKSLQDKQIRYSNANHKELTKKYLQLKEENEELRKELDNFKPVMFQDVRKGTVILYSKD